MKQFFSLLLTLLLIACATTESLNYDADTLEAEIQALIRDFEGDVGVYVRHLEKGTEVAIRADELFPTASMIKVPIMLKLFDHFQDPDDSLDYHSKLYWHEDTVNYAYDGGIMSSYAADMPIAMDKVVSLMITYSDNHASLWCQKLAGGGEAINEWLAAEGFERTRVNSRTEGRHGDWEVYGWGQTTPREMSELLVMIREGRAVNPEASEEMYKVLTKIYWDDEALSAIPVTVQSASKQGAVNASRSEVVLVNAPHGDYVFCVITKNQKDQSWDNDNPGFVLLREVSRVIWEHFEPS